MQVCIRSQSLCAAITTVSSGGTILDASNHFIFHLPLDNNDTLCFELVAISIYDATHQSTGLSSILPYLSWYFLMMALRRLLRDCCVAILLLASFNSFSRLAILAFKFITCLSSALADAFTRFS